MGLMDAIKNPVIAQLMIDKERQEKHIKQLESEIDVLKRSFSHDKEFVVTQNKVLAGRLRLLEQSINWLYSDCSRFSYFKTAWSKHLGRIKQ